MIEVSSTADGLVSVQASGKVDKQEWAQVTDAASEALSQHARVSIYADLADIEGMSAGAVIEDMRFSVQNLSSMDQVARVAVVTDSTWIEKMIEASERIFSDLDAHVFRQDQAVEARQWVNPKTPRP